MYNLSYKMFLNSLSIHATRLFEKAEPPGADLLPNDEFRRTLTVLKDIFESYDHSVVSTNSRKSDYAQVREITLFFVKYNFKDIFIYLRFHIEKIKKKRYWIVSSSP